MKFTTLFFATAIAASAQADSSSSTPARGLATLAEKWNLTEPLFSYDSLSFSLDFEVTDYIRSGMSQYSLYTAPDCKEGGDEIPKNAIVWERSELTDTILTNQAGGDNVDRTISLNFTLNSEEVVEAGVTFANFYGENTIDSQLIAQIRFCVRFGLWTPQGTGPEFSDGVATPVEVNFLETLITLTIDLTDGFEIGSIAVEPKDRLVRTANQAYEVIGFECKATADAAANWVELTDLENSERRNQGDVIVVCVEPEQEAKDDGIFMRSVDNFFFYRGADQAIRQDAVVNNNEAGNLLTSYNSNQCIGSTQCRFETILFARFYTSLGVVNGEGVASMQFGSDNNPGAPGRRQLRSEAADGRDLQEDAAGAAEFDLNFEVNQATLSDSGAGSLSALLAWTAAVLGVVAALL